MEHCIKRKYGRSVRTFYRSDLEVVSFISADIALATTCHRGSLRCKEDEKSECHPSTCMCRSPLGHSVLSHGPVYSGTRTIFLTIAWHFQIKLSLTCFPPIFYLLSLDICFFRLILEFICRTLRKKLYLYFI